jgi:hypothetical protein
MSFRFKIIVIIESYTEIQNIVCCDMFEQDEKTFHLRERIKYSDEVTGWAIRGLNPDKDKVFSLFYKMTRPAVGFSQRPIQ